MVKIVRKNNSIILIVVFCIAAAAHAQSISRQDAVNAISMAEDDMNEMVDSGFPVISVNDSIILARKTLDRADFAEIIRQNSSSYIIDQAKKALEGLNYEGFVY